MTKKSNLGVAHRVDVVFVRFANSDIGEKMTMIHQGVLLSLMMMMMIVLLTNSMRNLASYDDLKEKLLKWS